VTLAGGIPSSAFFHHVSLDQYGAITQPLLSVPIMLVWGPAAGLSAGRCYMVTDVGAGRNDAVHRTFVPFL
jgi:hypothetical protein